MQLVIKELQAEQDEFKVVSAIKYPVEHKEQVIFPFALSTQEAELQLGILVWQETQVNKSEAGKRLLEH